jgi:hypothetical protein
MVGLGNPLLLHHIHEAQLFVGRDNDVKIFFKQFNGDCQQNDAEYFPENGRAGISQFFFYVI